MVLGLELPKSNVIGAHIFKHAWAAHSESVLAFDDINDPRNGLFMYKPLEWAFDTSRMVILWDAAAGAFVARILDRSICDGLLDEKAKDLLSDRYRPAVNIGAMRFGDVDGRQLALPPGFSPFRRCIMFHALCARRRAETEGWIQPGSLVFEDFWSDAAESKAAAIRLWLETASADVPAETSSDVSSSISSAAAALAQPI
jgi:hypothetical protein